MFVCSKTDIPGRVIKMFDNVLKRASRDFKLITCQIQFLHPQNGRQNGRISKKEKRGKELLPVLAP